MNNIRYSGDVSNYITRFQRLEMQIALDDMTYGDRKFLFLKTVPQELAYHIRQANPMSMASVYEAARFWEQLRHPSTATRTSTSHYGASRQFKPPNAPRMPPFTLPSANSNMYAASLPSLGSGPMDLDNFEVRRPIPTGPQAMAKDMKSVRCFECNGLGHYARNCLRRRAGHRPLPHPPSNSNHGSRSHPPQ